MTIALVCLSAALIAALAGWALTAYLFLRYLDRDAQRAHEEREQHRQEVAQLSQARMEETANLLQRIQAPETAVAIQAARDAPPDPIHPDISSDQEMFDYYQRQVAGLHAQGAVDVNGMVE